MRPCVDRGCEFCRQEFNRPEAGFTVPTARRLGRRLPPSADVRRVVALDARKRASLSWLLILLLCSRAQELPV
jgi:hypothetical protein